MFDTGPSGNMMDRFMLPSLMKKRQLGAPPMGGGGFPGMGMPGGAPDAGMAGPAVMPQIDVGAGVMPPTFGPAGPSRNPQPLPKQLPSPGMMDKLSTARPGFWGKYNTIAQGMQPMAMDMLMGGNTRNRGY